MKTETDNIIKARELLEAWYEGSAASADETWLREFFAAANDLPADLEAEREMFLAIHEAATTPVSMPQEAADRLEQALNAEMSRGRGNIWKRRRIWMSASACLLAITAGVFVTRYLTGTTDNNTPEPRQALAEAPAKTRKSAASSHSSPVVGVASSLPAADARPDSPAKTEQVKTEQDISEQVKTEQAISEQAKSEPEKPELYLAALTEEEREMQAKGYRVVSSEMEAKAVVGLVMAKMHENVVESTFRISEMTESLDRIATAGQKPELPI